MEIAVAPEIVVKRPKSAVAAYMFEPANDAEWTKGVVACRPLTPGRLRPGSRVERVTRFLGREFSYVYEVTDAAGDDFVALRVSQPFPMSIRYELETAEDGTLVRIRARGDAGGFFGVAAPLLRIMVRRNIAKDLAALKTCMERGQAGVAPE